VCCLTTGVHAEDVRAKAKELADALLARIPASLGETGPLRLKARDIEAMLREGAA
jgi:RNA-splicing ligase RtcB